MPEDANTAESSPASETLTPMEMSGDQRAEWLKTGEAPKREASAPSQQTGAGDELDKPASGSDPEKKQEPGKKKNADSRIQELLDERHQLREELDRLKKGDKKPDPPPAEKANEKPAEKTAERPKRPKLNSFEGTYDEYEAALEKYEEDLAAFKANEVLAADRADREKSSKQSEVEAENAKTIERWNGQVGEAKKKYADYDAVAFNKDVPINGTTDAFILKDPLGAEILYKLASDVDESKRIAALDPFETMEALIEIKRSLNGSTKAPEKKNPTTKAPPAVTELTGRNTDPADEAEAALKARDFDRYKRIMNKREAQKE